VDLGYRGVEVPGVTIYKARQKRGVDTRRLKRALKRRNAIEPIIGHLKNDGLLGRNYLKGELGDALHAILCGAGHNIRMILRRLSFLASFLGATVSAWDDFISRAILAACIRPSIYETFGFFRDD
jgi:IS5 family transposase